jgi:hypothetical protein
MRAPRTAPVWLALRTILTIDPGLCPRRCSFERRSGSRASPIAVLAHRPVRRTSANGGPPPSWMSTGASRRHDSTPGRSRGCEWQVPPGVARDAMPARTWYADERNVAIGMAGAAAQGRRKALIPRTSTASRTHCLFRAKHSPPRPLPDAHLVGFDRCVTDCRSSLIRSGAVLVRTTV